MMAEGSCGQPTELQVNARQPARPKTKSRNPKSHPEPWLGRNTRNADKARKGRNELKLEQRAYGEALCEADAGDSSRSVGSGP